MAFGNPFQANVERKMNKAELIQAVRLDLSGELEAIYGYDAHVQATDNAAAKKVLADIRDEEIAHMGELLTLLRTLDPKEADLFTSGESEVRGMLGEIGITVPEQKAAGGGEGAKTVGSLLDKS
ncbi:MAG TPA: ubiquinone biosynthesis protein COQ7 [Ruminococcaceae bacterium]|jgi:rubrerythrin|nr:ubiquinone biosynthesis protein COQ7 [Oscillospiraceae bacterium]HBG56160.1 ubiquinone biosynthesis protein COQ7 [Oscillospiraceae bacterium]HBQ46737.1 ubiquinone biosynthesis protein COQ7 [Oscillospiraceae bacterium]HBT90868.1 ubiquinone biosynthesis protein COQ7 [Oscillospiraceae bacterium]HCB90566.1 ubiquinone biosynthesis protein COQ7 [Oscillospiraceae bacterium]